MRSLLLVPATSAEALSSALDCGADVVVVDLEATVPVDAEAAARAAMVDFVTRGAERAERPRLHVRIHGFGSGLLDADLDAAVAAGADGIVLPKAAGGMEITRLDAKIAVCEAVHGVAEGRTRIVAMVAETAHALLQTASFRGASRRLVGMAWSARSLAADLGATATRDTDGRLADAFRLARTTTLVGAVAADCAPIDEAHEPVDDLEGLAAACRAAAADGFTAKLARDPRQIPVINAAFTPGEGAIAAAARVVGAFAAAGDPETAVLDGMRLGRAQLVRARGVLARGGR